MIRFIRGAITWRVGSNNVGKSMAPVSSTREYIGDERDYQRDERSELGRDHGARDTDQIQIGGCNQQDTARCVAYVFKISDVTLVERGNWTEMRETR